MLYALLCYNDEATTTAWTKEEDDAVMADLMVVHERLYEKKQLGPAIRLMPTTAATTLRKNNAQPVVLDGPYAETKEQLLGFYIVEVDDLEAALDIGRQLAVANPGGAYEVRPLSVFLKGVPLTEIAAVSEPV